MKDIYIEVVSILNATTTLDTTEDIAHRITKMFTTEVLDPLTQLLLTATKGANCDCGE